jgi:hypothetical protein
MISNVSVLSFIQNKGTKRLKIIFVVVVVVLLVFSLEFSDHLAIENLTILS